MESKNTAAQWKVMRCDEEYFRDGARRRTKWIDCTKAAAITAVAVDHCNRILYTDPYIAWASYFSVSLFAILSGVTAWLSFYKTKWTWERHLKKAGRLLVQYAAATLILQIFYTGFFDLRAYISHLFLFSILSQNLWIWRACVFILTIVMPVAAVWLIRRSVHTFKNWIIKMRQ